MPTERSPLPPGWLAQGADGMGVPYKRSELAGEPSQKVYKGDHLQQIAFPLGGLGAGCLHLGGASNFQDFCLFNTPAFGHSPMTFAAAYCEEQERQTGVMRVLEGPVQNPHIYNQARFGNGALASGHEGLPHMECAEFRGEFPFAWVQLEDQALPLEVSLEAFSPLIPGDDIGSGLPAAFLSYRLRSRAKGPMRVQFSFNVQYPAPANMHGHDNRDLQGHRVYHRHNSNFAGLYFENDLLADDPRKVSIAVVSTLDGQRANCAWFRGGWFDALTVLTHQLIHGTLPNEPTSRPVSPVGRARFGATLFWNLKLNPGDQVEIPLIYCWYAPNSSLNYGRSDKGDETTQENRGYKPFYSTLYDDAWSVAHAAATRQTELTQRTREFHRALFRSSLPDSVLEAVSANLAILKSPTVLRQQDGSLWNWEGCSYGSGCCAGSCTHVWNYAQAIPYLFPALERTLRDQELKWSMDDRGHVTFRSALPSGPVQHDFHAAADGQLGGVMKVYRDWQISGDDTWLRERYPLVRRSMEYCMSLWDPDALGVLIEPHHNTYDIEFWGADVMCSSFYLGALRALALMAKALGHTDDAVRYGQLADKGTAYCDAHLWNGEYYYQQVEWKKLRASAQMGTWTDSYSDEAVELLQAEGPKYQYGTGCLSDGVIGQWYAEMLALPSVLDTAKTREHLKSVFRYNFKNSLQGHANPQRPGFALNDEPGLLLCTWPHGGKPALPFVYSDEVWTGIEYQVASHMIYTGLVEEGLTLVSAVRKRYDGKVRNPWNEYECGSYYARALASYAVLLALTGFRYSAVERHLEVAPRLSSEKGRFLFSVDSCWGSIHYEKRVEGVEIRIAPVEGELQIARISVDGTLVGERTDRHLEQPAISLPDKPVTILV